MENNWSIKIAETLLKGKPQLLNSWSYKNGIALKGLEKIWINTRDKKYFDFIKSYVDKFIFDIDNYDKHNIENISNGRLLFNLYFQTKNKKYKNAIYKLKSYLEAQPRTKEKVFCYKDIYKNQILLEASYMCLPFYAEYIKEFEDNKNYSDIVNQFLVYFNSLKDNNTSLLYNRLDETKLEFWCDKNTGLSKSFCSISMGIFMMSVIDVIDIIDDDQKNKKILIDILIQCLNSVIDFQDKNSGVWYHIIDQCNRKCNYVEASCSCAFLYSIAKAYNNKYLKGSKWLDVLDSCYNGIIDEFVLITDDGYINLNKIFQNVSFENDIQVDETFTYYMSEPIVCNDMKGVGIFLQAMFEYENMKR